MFRSRGWSQIQMDADGLGLRKSQIQMVADICGWRIDTAKSPKHIYSVANSKENTLSKVVPIRV